MYISYQKLDVAGYNVESSKDGLEIHPKEQLDLPFEEMRDLLKSLLSPSEIDIGFDAFVIEVELQQIMKVIR